MARQFCTDVAMACGEPQEGTGAMAERHLFIAWPKGKWRRPRWQAAELIEPLQVAMQAASGDGRYVGLAEGADIPALTLISFPDGITIMPDSQEHAVDLVRAWADGEPLPGRAIGRKVILCCTDAKTDACCARYGYPVYKAIAEEAEHYDLMALQCTHIGGCRFAPSVIVMPDRARYGRVTPADVPAFLQCLSEGRFYLQAYKGRAALDEPHQIAELAAMRWAESHGAPQELPQLRSAAAPSPGRMQIDLAVGDTRLTASLAQQTFDMPGSCRDVEAGVSKPTQRWTIIGLDEAR
jgi:hypothetical protein